MLCALKQTEALELGAQIGQALGRLHNAGVIHGDLTTSNMMIKEDGSLVRPHDQRHIAMGCFLFMCVVSYVCVSCGSMVVCTYR
jgi:serine/threonine protein kinase